MGIKNLKDFPKEKQELFILSKEIKTILSENPNLLYSLIELRVIKNKLSYIIEKFEKEVTHA